MKKRFTEAQIIGFLKEADAGGSGEGTLPPARLFGGEYYLWRSKFGAP